MYILQDAVKPNRLQFSVIAPIKTVYSLLSEKDALHLITDNEAVELVRFTYYSSRSLPFCDADVGCN